MNNVRYSEEFDVFVCDKDEQVQFSSMDLMTDRRIIAGFVVFRICFGWLSDKNPLYKIKKNTIKSNPFQNDIIDAYDHKMYVNDKLIKLLRESRDLLLMCTLLDKSGQCDKLVEKIDEYLNDNWIE